MLANTNSTKRKERVKQTAEVFTPISLVNDMLNKLPAESWEDGKTFIDPACGNGNFLLEVLKRKIAKGHDVLSALNTLHGIDIMLDNVDECRLRLLKVVSQHTKINFRHIETVLINIVCANALEYDMLFDQQFDYSERSRIYHNLDQLLSEVDIDGNKVGSVKEFLENLP